MPYKRNQLNLKIKMLFKDKLNANSELHEYNPNHSTMTSTCFKKISAFRNQDMAEVKELDKVIQIS